MALRKHLAAELGSGFFGGLADGFESGHKVRNDLNHEQKRNQRAWVKSGGKFWGEPLLAPSAMKTMNKASVPKEVQFWKVALSRMPR